MAVDCKVANPCVHGTCQIGGSHCNCLPGWKGNWCDKRKCYLVITMVMN